ncbi:MAG: DUF3043 domain-containing protein [Streptosporangiaceae bacterium]
MFLRRRAADPPTTKSPAESNGATETATSTGTPGKGRPTPKRREAEQQRRRRPVTAPRDRKEAYRQVKGRQRDQRRRQREGLARGEERYLPARDKGPARKLARDYVDSRRNLGEYFLYAMIVVIALTFVPTTLTRFIAYYVVWPVIMVVVLTDSAFIWRGISRLVREKYPEESTRGIAWYAVTRALQIRRLRLPPPQVKRGDRLT